MAAIRSFLRTLRDRLRDAFTGRVEPLPEPDEEEIDRRMREPW